MYQGNLTEDQILNFTFTSRAFSTGVPTTLAGTPSLAIYKADGVTQSTAGITLTVDFDSVTGLNQVKIDTSADAFYAVANDYSVVVAAGTVGGTSVVGETVATFSIENRFKEADVVAIQGDTQSATDLKDFADAGYDPATNKVQGVVLTDTVTTYTGNTPQTGDAFARLGAPAGASVSADIATRASQASVDAIDDFLDTEVAAILADTNELQTDWANGGRLDLILDARASQASVDAIDDFLDTEVAAILADTNELQTDWANGGRLDLILDARSSQASVDDLPTNAELATALADADNAVLAAIAALNNLSAAQVNAEVLDVLNVDTFAEPAAVPAATASLVAKIGWLAALARNKLTSTATTLTLRNDADSGNIAQASQSDDATTYTRGEWA